MAKVCHSCGKGPAFGNSRSHSMVATRRRFDPNLQKVRILVGKAPRRVYVCTRCLKAGKVAQGALSAAPPDAREVPGASRVTLAGVARSFTHGCSRSPPRADRDHRDADRSDRHQPASLPRRRRRRARASGVPPPGGQRPQRLPRRRRRHRRQHGAHAARRAGASSTACRGPTGRARSTRSAARRSCSRSRAPRCWARAATPA